MTFSKCRPLGFLIGTIGLVINLSACYQWRSIAPQRVASPKHSMIRVTVKGGPPVVLYDALAISDSIVGFRRSDGKGRPKTTPQRIALGEDQIEKVERHSLDGYLTVFTVAGVTAGAVGLTALVVAVSWAATADGW